MQEPVHLLVCVAQGPLYQLFWLNNQRIPVITKPSGKSSEIVAFV